LPPQTIKKRFLISLRLRLNGKGNEKKEKVWKERR
jgi:hypothetical protein